MTTIYADNGKQPGEQVSESPYKGRFAVTSKSGELLIGKASSKKAVGLAIAYVVDVLARKVWYSVER